MTCVVVDCVYVFIFIAIDDGRVRENVVKVKRSPSIVFRNTYYSKIIIFHHIVCLNFVVRSPDMRNSDVIRKAPLIPINKMIVN